MAINLHRLIFVSLLLFAGCSQSTVCSVNPVDPALTEMKDDLVDIVLKNVAIEFPYNAAHTYNSPEDVGELPRELHPSFWGSYDHHSCVHNHWVLVYLLRVFGQGGLARALDAIEHLNNSLTPENIAVEMDYFIERQSYERPYGWAWILYLTREAFLASATLPEAVGWLNALAPFADLLSTRLVAFLPNQTYPLRTGTHSSTAFALTLCLDYAIAVGDENLRASIVRTSLFYFENDYDLPSRLEPGGEEFVSPSLQEATLMQLVLSQQQQAPSVTAFQQWLDVALPAIHQQANMMNPVVVADRSDYKIVHLDGLNLARSWNLRRLLCSGDVASEEVVAAFAAAQQKHLDAALPHTITGDYGGDHWLCSFALLSLSESYAAPSK